MRAPISVIIPTLNAENSLPDCLSSLGEGLSRGLIRELIISDGGSTDETSQIAEYAGAEFLKGAPSRGGQLRRAADAAAGDWLLVLHADTCLLPGWSDAVARVLTQPNAYYFDLRFDAQGLAPRLVASWANLRSRLLHLPYGDQGLLIERQIYKGSAGYPDIPLMEDVALARKLGRRMKPLGAFAQTSADKFERQGWLMRGSRNLMTLGRYLTGADPENLARAYRK